MAKDHKNQELDGLAGEYVLGSLTSTERLEFERRMKSDPALARSVGEWRERLTSLDTASAVEHPPENLLGRVFAEIDRREQNDSATPSQIVKLQQRIKVWRNSAVLAGAVAAGLAMFIAVNEISVPIESARENSYIAVLQADDKSPQFVASIDLARGEIDVVRLGQQPASGKDYELWAVGAGRPKPVSLGLIGSTGMPGATTLTAPFGKSPGTGLKNAVFAISLEPSEGSPTGQPTGPVLFSGKLVRINQ